MLWVLNPLGLGGTQLQVPEIPNDGCHQEVYCTTCGDHCLMWLWQQWVPVSILEYMRQLRAHPGHQGLSKVRETPGL